MYKYFKSSSLSVRNNFEEEGRQEENIILFKMRNIFIIILYSVFLLSGCRKENPITRADNPSNTPHITLKPILSRDYKNKALDLINDARKYVYVWMFEIANYREGPNPLLSALCRARKRGVDVKVLVEGGEDFLGERFYKKQKGAYEFLKSCGIKVRFDRKGRTTHVKMLLADTSLLIGSTNWTYYGLERNTELNVLIQSSETVQFKELFLKAYRDARKNTLNVPQNARKITVKGVVTYVQEKVSRRGRAYTIFKIKSKRKTYRVFIRGHHHIRKGERLLVKGLFYKVKKVGNRTFHNEIEASYIRRI